MIFRRVRIDTLRHDGQFCCRNCEWEECLAIVGKQLQFRH